MAFNLMALSMIAMTVMVDKLIVSQALCASLELIVCVFRIVTNKFTLCVMSTHIFVYYTEIYFFMIDLLTLDRGRTPAPPINDENSLSYKTSKSTLPSSEQ